MKKLSLLFFLLLAGLTSVHATGGTGLVVRNVRNAVPGYTGSFDVYYSSINQVRDFLFDVTLPDGLTYKSYAEGDLMNGHTVTVSDQGNNTTRFTVHSTAGNKMTAQGGTLLTIYFDVASTATGTLGGIVSNIKPSNDQAKTSVGHSDRDFSVPVGHTVTLTDNDSGAPAAIDNVSVNVLRTLTAGKWNTICLPFAMTTEQVVAAFGDDAKLGDFAGYTVNGDNIHVSFTTATAIAANHPYLLKVANEVSDFTVEGVNIESSCNTMVNFGSDATDEHIKAMVGVYEEMTLPAYRLYIKDNTFKYSNGTSKIRPYRAYFHFCDFNAGNHARSFVIDDEFTTSIGEAIRFDGNGQSSMVNGLYDLNGRKLTTKPSTKGVYVQDGNKVIVK